MIPSLRVHSGLHQADYNSQLDEVWSIIRCKYQEWVNRLVMEYLAANIKNFHSTIPVIHSTVYTLPSLKVFWKLFSNFVKWKLPSYAFAKFSCFVVSLLFFEWLSVATLHHCEPLCTTVNHYRIIPSTTHEH